MIDIKAEAVLQGLSDDDIPLNQRCNSQSPPVPEEDGVGLDARYVCVLRPGHGGPHINMSHWPLRFWFNSEEWVGEE